MSKIIVYIRPIFFLANMCCAFRPIPAKAVYEPNEIMWVDHVNPILSVCTGEGVVSTFVVTSGNVLCSFRLPDYEYGRDRLFLLNCNHIAHTSFAERQLVLDLYALDKGVRTLNLSVEASSIWDVIMNEKGTILFLDTGRKFFLVDVERSVIINEIAIPDRRGRAIDQIISPDGNSVLIIYEDKVSYETMTGSILWTRKIEMQNTNMELARTQSKWPFAFLIEDDLNLNNTRFRLFNIVDNRFLWEKKFSWKNRFDSGVFGGISRDTTVQAWNTKEGLEISFLPETRNLFIPEINKPVDVYFCLEGELMICIPRLITVKEDFTKRTYMLSRNSNKATLYNYNTGELVRILSLAQGNESR